MPIGLWTALIVELVRPSVIIFTLGTVGFEICLAVRFVTGSYQDQNSSNQICFWTRTLNNQIHEHPREALATSVKSNPETVRLLENPSLSKPHTTSSNSQLANIRNRKLWHEPTLTKPDLVNCHRKDLDSTPDQAPWPDKLWFARVQDLNITSVGNEKS
jgi:hypothetical protein